MDRLGPDGRGAGGRGGDAADGVGAAAGAGRDRPGAALPPRRGPVARVFGVFVLLVVAAGAAAALYVRSRGTVTTAAGSYEEFVFNLAIYRPGEMLRQIFFERIPHLLDEIMVTASFALDLPVGLNVPLAIVLVVAGVALVRRRLAWGLWVAAMLAVMIGVVAVDRYVVSILPFLVYGWWRAMSWINRRLRHPYGDWAFAALLALSTVPNAVKSGGMIIEQRRPDFLVHYKDGRYDTVSKMADHVARHVRDEDVVLAPQKNARVLSYLSRRRVVGTLEPVKVVPSEQPVYVVLDPEDAEQRGWVQSLRLELPDPIESVPRRKQPPLTLHRAVVRE